MSADYEVGYKRPPKQTRFQRGRSGNPRGRPKGARNFEVELQEALGQTVLVREAGAERRVTRRGAVVLSLLAKALKGDVRAAAWLIAAEQRAEASERGGAAEDEAPPPPLSADEAEVLEAFEARVRGRLLRRLDGGEPGP